MNDQAGTTRWYNHPLVTSATSFLLKSGILISACFLVLYIAIRASAVLDAPIVSARADKFGVGGIVYKLPLRIEYVTLDWDVEACEFDADTRVFNVVMRISETTKSRIVPDPSISYRIDQKSLLNWAFSSSLGIKLTDDGFIQEFVLNSVGDVVDNFYVQPAKTIIRAVQIPPQNVPGLTFSVEDQCGASVVAALKLKQAANALSDGDRQVVPRAIAAGILSYSESRQIIPRFDGAIKADGTGSVRPFSDSQRFGPVMKLASALLSIEIKIDAVESGQVPAEQPPVSVEGIIFRAPGLATITFCVDRCQHNRPGNVESSSIESFPQLGSYMVIPVVRRPFSTLAVAITGDNQGRLKAIHLGEKQQVPGREKTPAKESDPAPYEVETPPAALEQDPSKSKTE